jgi:predicted ferric reductase
VADIAAVAVGLGLGASAALPLSNTSLSALKAPGAWAILAGDVTAMTGTYLLLVMVLLAARIAPLEKVLGQDKLVRWHRRLSSAPLLLLTAHAVLTTLGYAESAHVGLMGEAGSLITTMRWVLAAVVAYAMFVLIAGASIRAVRRRFNYDTWWVIHLYTYLALAFSVPHQIFEGTDFVGHPWA